jgi:ketosteroid isomerase-like protein
LANADTTTLAAGMADSLVWVVATGGAVLTKSDLLAAASHRQVPAPRFDIDSVRVRLLGDVALVDYRRGDHRQVGSYERTTWTRVLDVFAHRRGGWLLERHTQTWLVVPVTPVSSDSAALAGFVGRYRIGPGYIDDVHWEGRHLVATASGQTAGATLVPVSVAAFSPDGVGPMIVFERDTTGHVVGYVQALPDGQVVRASRLP